MISEKQSLFVDKKYLPRGVNLNDPRGMKREAMTKFFEHITLRQSTSTIKDAFRFKAVLSSRKKGSLRETKYPAQGSPGAAFQSAPALTREPAPVVVTAQTSLPAPSFDSSQLYRMPSIHPRLTPGLTRDSTPVTGGASSSGTTPGLTRDSTPMTFQQQTLTLDPAYAFDPPIILDESLEPAFDVQGFGNHNQASLGTHWLTVPPVSTFNYNSASNSQQSTVRRRGKSADTLAIEEAQLLLARQNSRR